jgi:hypothetical protein
VVLTRRPTTSSLAQQLAAAADVPTAVMTLVCRSRLKVLRFLANIPSNQLSVTAMLAMLVTASGRPRTHHAVERPVVATTLASVAVRCASQPDLLDMTLTAVPGRGARYPRDHDDRHNKSAPQ